MDRATECFLIPQGAFAIHSPDIFGPGPEIRRDQPERHAILMKPPACVVFDRVHTNIHQIALRNLRKASDILRHIGDEQIGFFAFRRSRAGQHCGECRLRLIQLDEDTATGQGRPGKRIKPIL